VKSVELCATNFQEESERKRQRERERQKGCYHHPGNYPEGNYLLLEHA
jgi:hypothetical protein